MAPALQIFRRPPTPFILALLLAISTAGCASKEERFRAHRERAAEYSAERRFDEALIELRNALALNPHDARTNFEIAQVLGKQERFGQAVYYYAEARRLDPTFLDAYLAEAAVVLRVDPDRAMELINVVLEQHILSVKGRVRLAEVELVRGHVQAALDKAREAVELGPDDAEASHVLGEACLAQIVEGERAGSRVAEPVLEQALAAFERAAELGDVESRWRSLVGRAGVLSLWPTRSHQAGESFRQAILAAKESPESQHSVTAVRAARSFALSVGDETLRRQFLEMAIDVEPADMSGWVELARLEEESEGDPDAVFARLLEQRARDPQAHVTWAEWLADHRRRAEGMAHLEKAIEDEISPPELLEALGTLQLDEGDREAFARTVNRLLDDYPEHRSTRRAAARRAILSRSRVDAAVEVRELAGHYEDPEVQRLLALAEFQLGNLEAATAAIDRSLALRPASPVRTLALKSRIRHAASDWESTLLTLAQLVAYRPLVPEEELILARCFYGMERSDDGRRILARLASGPQPYVPALLELAQREVLDDPRQARERLEVAYASAPEGGAVLLRRLILYDVALGEEERALQRLDAALERKPDLAYVRLERAKLLGRMGRMQEAEAEVGRALALRPHDPDALNVQVEIFRARGELDSAIAVFQEEDRAGRLPPGRRAQLARFLAVAGDEAGARQQYERVVDSGANLPLAKHDLALLLARRGENLGRAHALVSEALAVLPEEPVVLDTFGYVLLRRGLAEAAEEQFRNAIRFAEAEGTERALYHYHLGLALRMRRRNLSAVTAFERALELNPDFPGAERAREEREAAFAGEPLRLQGF